MGDLAAYEVEGHAGRERRILDHMSLVRSIAHGIAATVPRSVESADLVGAGMVGLIRAVDSFDNGRDTSFESFARRHVRGAILDYLRAQDPLPYSTRSRIRRVERSIARLQQELHHTPDAYEIAADLGCAAEEVLDLFEIAARTTLYSLEELVERVDAVPECTDGAFADPGAGIEDDELQRLVVGWLGLLPRTERLVLTLYYHERLKMKEIGAVLGVTESRVSQIHAAAVASLRVRVRAALEPARPAP